MGVLAKHKNQITLFFSSENALGKQIEPYVVSSGKDVLAVDISKTNVTETQWTALAEGLGIEVSELIGKEHPDFKQAYGGDAMDLNPTDWLKILGKNPHLLKYPIVLNGNEYIALESSASFKKYMEPDSAGIQKPDQK